MAEAPHLTIGELLQLVRYELRLKQADMAEQCGLCPCCYDRIERDAADDMTEEELADLAEILPGLSNLLRGGSAQDPQDTERFLARLDEVEAMSGEERATEFARVRLELSWIDG